MPELPEVEFARRVIAEHALEREIAVVDDTDTYVCRPHAPGELHHALAGRALTVAHRRGKSMWVETTGDGPALGLHLGMAGRIFVDDHSGGDPAPYIAAGANPAWDRFTLRFADGGRLVLHDPRRLGRAVLDPDVHGLGPDAAEVGRTVFRDRVRFGIAPLKARIMDQAVVAGVGNLLADEALWQARLSPVRPAGELDDDEVDRLRLKIRAGVRHALRHGGVHHGEVIPFRKAGERCPRCGAEMVRDTVGGRTTWWCPVEQT
jgi:formamidopyrimidine-DNA glycosylase